ncbi:MULTISPECIES: hypothetical protein [Haloarcula]|uniref:hypothetical protein n=1 Tax=Haloarcula TaxID=2237 RepID=UPI0023EC89E8|nr:hypothetical protein [Halomicroarcula sp. XH51]
MHGRGRTPLWTTSLVALLLSLGSVGASYVTTADWSAPVLAGTHQASPRKGTPRPRRVRDLLVRVTGTRGGR